MILGLIIGLAVLQVALYGRMKQDLRKVKGKVMAKQDELIAQLKGLRAAQDASVTQLQKIEMETDGLQQAIVDLKAALAQQPGPTQDLVDAINDVTAGHAAVQAAIQAEDDKVPDGAAATGPATQSPTPPPATA